MIRKNTNAPAMDDNATFGIDTFLRIRNPQSTIAVKARYTSMLKPLPINKSEIAIAAKGMIKAKRRSLNCAPENIAKAPIAVKFQMCGISRGNALVNAAQTINIVKTKNRGDLICCVIPQNYKFFPDV